MRWIREEVEWLASNSRSSMKSVIFDMTAVTGIDTSGIDLITELRGMLNQRSLKITSLSQTVDFLTDFMESYDSHGCTRAAAEVLESEIATATLAARDVIESHVVKQIRAGSTRSGKATSYFLLDLQRAISNMEFVKRKAMQFKAKSGLKVEQPTYTSSSTATSSEPLELE